MNINCLYVKDGDRLLPLLTSEGVLEAIDVSDGQLITQNQMWEVIRLNAATLVGEVKLRELTGEQRLPDTKELETLIAADRNRK